ncbi:MAG: hypothetical protein JXA42_26175, partial [Anaerolineales bacterium]|nr:hypothetical protein [Anaerolineales bacterium]
FRSDRDEEYAEFCERCEALLTELDKESGREKFTFAELEETEEDLKKLNNWLNKILARDFAGGNQRQDAMGKIEQCRKVYTAFARQVYEAEGIPSDTRPNNHAENLVKE